MTNNELLASSLEKEWQLLHHSYERSEALALLIKLTALLVCLFGLYLQLYFVSALLIAVLWLQEAIWKTVQGRTEQRLIAIEKARVENDESAVLCYYSNWNITPRSVKKLLREYLSNTLKPTIAYPYIILLAISFISQLYPHNL